ncbi:MAG: uroporphyrinogen decarboxylase [Thermoanaerobaculia bacterium]|nr:uroporphyrinogen decarboxylase [Thermoanaerobaculia bacterium]
MKNDLFLRACRGERTERYPVWIMRQAGRYLAEYREIRKEVDFLTLCRTPELVAEVTLQPVRLVGVDAAIVFADILLPLDAMGAGLHFVKGEGPQFETPVRNRQQLRELERPDVEKGLGYVFDALRLVRRELDGEVPLIGFAGTPWTLAAYLVEGGPSKSYAHLLEWSYEDPEGLGMLLDEIADLSVDYLRGQVEAGAQALQLFDTWGGLLSAKRWRKLAEPSLRKILEGIGDRVPRIYYVNGGHHLLPATRELPVDVLSVDWRVPLDEIRREVGPGKVLQGNLDPGALLGPEEEIRDLAREMLDRVDGQPHVGNLGHGILPMTPPDHARAFVSAVKSYPVGG